MAMKMRFTNEWLRRRIEEEPDDVNCEAGHPPDVAELTGWWDMWNYYWECRIRYWGCCFNPTEI